MSTSAQSERAIHRSRGAIDRCVLQVASQVSAAIGGEFFRSVVEHLAEVLKADCVYIGEFLGGHVERVKTLAACLDHRPVSFEYELAGSASAQAALGKPCICRAQAQKRFPADPMFPQWNAQAYVGIPLLNSSGFAARRPHERLSQDHSRYGCSESDPRNVCVACRGGTGAQARGGTAQAKRRTVSSLRRAQRQCHVAHRIRSADLHRTPGAGTDGTHLPGRLFRGVQRCAGAPGGVREGGASNRPPGARPGVAVESHRPQRNSPCHPYEVPVHHGGNVAGRPATANAGICCEASGALSKTERCGASGEAIATSPN